MVAIPAQALGTRESPPILPPPPSGAISAQVAVSHELVGDHPLGDHPLGGQVFFPRLFSALAGLQPVRHGVPTATPESAA